MHEDLTVPGITLTTEKLSYDLLLELRLKQFNSLPINEAYMIIQALGISIPEMADISKWTVQEMREDNHAVTPLIKTNFQFVSEIGSQYRITASVTETPGTSDSSAHSDLSSNIDVSEVFELTIEDPNPSTDNPVPKIHIRQDNINSLGEIKQVSKRDKMMDTELIDKIVESPPNVLVTITVNSDRFSGTVSIFKSSNGTATIDIQSASKDDLAATGYTLSSSNTMVALSTSNEKEVMATLAKRHKSDPLKFASVVLINRLQHRNLDLLVLDQKALAIGDVAINEKTSPEASRTTFITRLIDIFQSKGYVGGKYDQSGTKSDQKSMAVLAWEAAKPAHLNLPIEKILDMMESKISIKKEIVDEANANSIGYLKPRIAYDESEEEQERIHNMSENEAKLWFLLYDKFDIIPRFATPFDMDAYYKIPAPPPKEHDISPERRKHLEKLAKIPHRKRKDEVDKLPEEEKKLFDEIAQENRSERYKYLAEIGKRNRPNFLNALILGISKQELKNARFIYDNLKFVDSYLNKYKLQATVHFDQELFQTVNRLQTKIEELEQIGEWTKPPSKEALLVHRERLMKAYSYLNYLPLNDENKDVVHSMIISIFQQIRSLMGDSVWHNAALAPVNLPTENQDDSKQKFLDYKSGESITLRHNECDVEIGVYAREFLDTGTKDQILSIKLRGQNPPLSHEPVTLYIHYVNGRPISKYIFTGNKYQQYEQSDNTKSNVTFSDEDPRSVLNNSDFSNIEEIAFELFRSQLGTN